MSGSRFPRTPGKMSAPPLPSVRAASRICQRVPVIPRLPPRRPPRLPKLVRHRRRCRMRRSPAAATPQARDAVDLDPRPARRPLAPLAPCRHGFARSITASSALRGSVDRPTPSRRASELLGERGHPRQQHRHAHGRRVEEHAAEGARRARTAPRCDRHRSGVREARMGPLRGRREGAVPRLHGVRSGTAGAEHERTQRVERAPREHHAADGRRADRAAREGAHPGAGSIWLAGRSRRPGATTRRARGDTPENAQITVQAGTPQGSRTAGVPLLPMEHQAGVVRGAELVDEDGQTSRDGLADDPRARHVELGDELIKLHELSPRQAHLGGSIKRLGSGVRRRLGSGQATTATPDERQRSAQRKGAATAPTSRPIAMNDWAGHGLVEGLVDDVRHHVEVRRERGRDRLDDRPDEVRIRIRDAGS